jgi:hypothetical protein
MYSTQQHIAQAVGRLTLIQQQKLLEFIYALQADTSKPGPQGLLSFAGVFDTADYQDFNRSLRDCENIDQDGW